MDYSNHVAIDKKWQDVWYSSDVFKAENNSDKPSIFTLIEFPYPSGIGLHVGHTRPYTAMDVLSRKLRMDGKNVLFPIGWDAFGLPAENFAIKNKIHPSEAMSRNVKNFTAQAKALGYSFDWSREVNTTDPEFYRWTQWIFLKMFEKGLAYKKKMSVNWCTSCLCVKANEEVIDGTCEICGAPVIRREKEQWMLRITEYADRLIEGLDRVDFPARVKAQQINWIGRSTGAEVEFGTTAGDKLKVFTTRPDTLYGVTYMVISPEHPILETWADRLANYADVLEYRKKAASKSDFERSELAKEKTGVRLDGVCAVNPVNGTQIPIFVSDYVLMSYGTGAIMAVPAHDTRDYDFAKAFDLPIIEVVAGGDVEKEAFTDCETGTMVNSGMLDGLSVEEAKKKITAWLTEQGVGVSKVNYKLRDWIFARQRYWGEPIPVIWCDACGKYVPVPEDQLPVTLPDVRNYEPTTTGESPLAKVEEWVNTTCPCCGGPARRETDTMPQWAGSSWYYLRYADPKNKEALASKEALAKWSPVDWYNGGMEHTTLHLLYSRFWHKFLYDIGVVPTDEPYKKRTSQGMILGEDGEKMSKSRGNGVDPDKVIAEYGADTLRMYIMFIGDFEKTARWNSAAVKGCQRFIDRVCGLADRMIPGDTVRPEHELGVNRAIRKVGSDIMEMKFNTAIAALMTLVNEFYDSSDKNINKAELSILIRLLAPFAPHICEELWEPFGQGLVAVAPWPEYDEAKTVEDSVNVAVQINGKLRATIRVARDSENDVMIAAAKAEPKIAAALEGVNVVREIAVKNKIVNFVVKPAK
ncbi:MAG: leucine--tRNA ligase [Ruminococcaceae bacterium]|nr:leucine--tRNA ligase [Oscillospiraceae bacterium]